jgi:hypothetical protein
MPPGAGDGTGVPVRDTGIDCATISVMDSSQEGHIATMSPHRSAKQCAFESSPTTPVADHRASYKKFSDLRLGLKPGKGKVAPALHPQLRRGMSGLKCFCRRKAKSFSRNVCSRGAARPQALCGAQSVAIRRQRATRDTHHRALDKQHVLPLTHR